MFPLFSISQLVKLFHGFRCPYAGVHEEEVRFQEVDPVGLPRFQVGPGRVASH